MSESESHQDPEENPPRRPSEPLGSATEIELREALAASRRHGTDLAEQSLGFVREIGRLRQVEKTLAETLRQLESNRIDLEVARRMARVGRVDRLRPIPIGATGRLAAVIWGGVPTAAHVDAVVGALTDAVPVTCLVPDDEARPDGLADAVAWVNSQSGGSLAHAVNLGLAVCVADAILFLHVSAVPDPGRWLDLPATAADTLFLQPRVVDPGVEALGLHVGEDLLRTARNRFQGDPKGFCDIDGADPRAFVLQVQSAAALGPFAPEILGPLSLVDAFVRGQKLGFMNLGCPELCVRTDVESVPVADPVADRDRLLMVARYRPESMGSAFVRAEFLWEIDPVHRRAFFKAVAQRLPDAHRWPEGIEFIADTLENAMQVAVSPTERRRADADARAQVLARAEKLSAELQQSADPSLRGLTARLADLRTASLAGDAADRLAEVEIDARVHLVKEVGRLEAERAALESLRATDERVLAELRQELADTQAAVAAEQESLAAERESHALKRAQIKEAWSAVAAELSTIGEHGLLTNAPSAEGFETEISLVALHAATKRLREVAGADGESMLPSVLDRFLDCIRQLSRDCSAAEAQIAETQRRVESLQTTLAEREEWIALLLPEVKRRRLRPRPLAQHESDFLDRHQRRKS